MASDYKDLLVWQKAMDLVVSVYEITKAFPHEERFGLTNQVRRAAVSIASNIAEGQGRRTNPDFARFLRMANGSRQEVETQLLIAARLKMLDEVAVIAIHDQLIEIGRMISGLLSRLPNDV